MIALGRGCWCSRLIAGILGALAVASSSWGDVDRQFELSLSGQFFPNIKSSSADVRQQFLTGLEAEFTSDFDFRPSDRHVSPLRPDYLQWRRDESC